MSDEIRLTLPRARPFYGVAHLVLGGLAVRLDLTFETLEDLQLALENLLDQAQSGGDLTVHVRVDGDVLRATVGPFARTDLASLEADGEADAVTVGRVLHTVVDAIEIDERAGGSWVDITKKLRRAGA